MGKESPDRRKFLKTATVAIGGVIGAVTAFPLVRYLLYPVGKKVVKSSGEPVDVIAVDQLPKGGPPVRVEIKAEEVTDAWSVTRDVALGAAYVRRDDAGKISVLSSVCPHLGCAVDYDEKGNKFLCPCHKSSFQLDGKKEHGPSKRGLDPLPHKEKDGRLLVTWVQYKPDVPDREPK
jgi:Rieske Fe-S protein